MEKLIELLQQIQELAGVAVDALKGASSGDKPDEGGKPPEGGPPNEGGGRPGGPPQGGGGPPMQKGEPDGGKPDGDEMRR